MNIGFDGSRAFISHRTGTENYAYQLLIHLGKIDQTNKYYVFVRPGFKTTENWPDNFHFITIPYPRLWTQVGLAHQTFKSPHLDLLFVPSHTLPIIRKPGLKTVITVHDLGAEYLPQTHQLKQKLYLNMMTHHQLKGATHILAVSQATKDDIVKKVGINPQKITVTYEGFDKSFYKPAKNDALRDVLKKYDLVDKNYFLYVGTIQPRKNIARLIEAYAQFREKFPEISKKDLGGGERGAPLSARNAMRTSNGAANRQDPLNTSLNLPTLILAGGKGWMSEDIYNLPQKLGVDKYVTFLGYVPTDELPALYSGCLSFVFPSLFEGFGLPILEAMACGAPVITSTVSSMPEVGGDAALLVDPYSQDEIAEALIQLYQNSKLRDQMKQRGFDQIKKFSWDKCAQETLQVFTYLSPK